MDKSDLKKAAFELALAETYARAVYERYTQKAAGVSMAEVNKSEADVIRARQKVQEIQSQIPELKEKEYWWSVPFDLSKPTPEIPDTFSLARGVYTEQDDVDMESPIRLRHVKQRHYGADVVNLFLSGFQDSKMILYANRKELKKHLVDWIDIKEIIVCETDVAGAMGGAGTYQGVKPGSVEYVRMQQQIRRDAQAMGSIGGNLEDELAALDQKWDFRERLFHDSIFVNKERWMMGKMSSEDYYREELWREYDQAQARNKALEEESRIRHRIEQTQRQMQQARSDYARFIAQNSVRQVGRANTLRFIRCGQVFYYNDEIMAITISTTPQPIYEAKYKGAIQIDDLEGEIAGYSIMMRKVPDPIPLMEYVLEQYGPKLKSHNVLASRPSGANDDMWRLWFEKRFLYELYLKNASLED